MASAKHGLAACLMLTLVAMALCADAAPAPQKPARLYRVKPAVTPAVTPAEPQKPPAAELMQKRKAVMVDERTAAEIFIDMLVPSAPELLRQVLVEDTIRRNRLHVKARAPRAARTNGSVHVAAVPAAGRWSLDGYEYEANTPMHAYGTGYSNRRRSYILQPDADSGEPPAAYDESLDDQYYEGGPDPSDRYAPHALHEAHEDKPVYDDAPKIVPTSPVRGQAKLVVLADVEYHGGVADTGSADATKAAANMFLIGRAASPTNETLTSGSLLPDGEWGYYQLTATGNAHITPIEGKPFLTIQGWSSYPTEIVLVGKLTTAWSEFERNTANTIVEHGRVPSPLLHQRLKVDPSTCIYRGPCGELTGSAVLTGLEVTSLAELREGWSWIPQHSVKLVCTINPRQAISCPPAAT